MNFESEAGWQLHPLDGATGKAFMGTKDEQKLFLKKNTSPFLAALSLEGISPRLVWTKRMGNGDVLTAQEWCNGRTLERSEMSSSRVVQKLSQVHRSQTLKKMLQRVEGRSVTSTDLLSQFLIGLVDDLRSHPTIIQAVDQLETTKQQLPLDSEHCVCHGDASHKNWLLSDSDDLYLVDWDSVVLADPAYDLGQYLSRYGKQLDDEEWLSHYTGIISKQFKEKVLWYQIMASLNDIKEYYYKRRLNDLNDSLTNLDTLLQQLN